MKLNRISLNTIGLNRIGLNRIGSPSRGSSELPYLDPELKAKIAGIWIADQNTNDSPTRNIIKNKFKDKGGDFELLNFNYKDGSGYGKYTVDYKSSYHVEPASVKSYTSFAFVLSSILNSQAGAIYRFINVGSIDEPSYKIRISNFTKGELRYNYVDINGNRVYETYTSNGDYTLPISYNSKITSAWSNGFFTRGITDCMVEQIPSFQGAVVTDGVDDLIVSQKTVSEMLGDNTALTVVTMMTNLTEIVTYNNQIRGTDTGYIRNKLTASNGKTGIYGYSISNTNVPISSSSSTLINNILGDKNDYYNDIYTGNTNGKFSVEGYLRNDGVTREHSSVAWYWTFIAKAVLTTDEINQIIAYYNLDKYVKPDVYYDVKKQGLSNDTPDADWYLKDFSDNGRDMQLYNFIKKLGSGIGKYEADYSTWTKTAGVEVTSHGFKIIEGFTSTWWILFLYNTVVPAHKIKISGIPVGGNLVYDITTILENGINELPEMEATGARGFTISMGTTQPSDWVGLSVEQIPDYEGALVTDGVSDYGKVENLPIYKDYTVVADREIVDGLITNADGGVATRGTSFNNGAFCFDFQNSVFSFGNGTSKEIDVRRFISYQSKYINNGLTISAGDIIDTNPLCIAGLGYNVNRYSKLALWSFLLFPYTLSEFLLERQLKRYKLGTLYPDMIEWRPIIKSNGSYEYIKFYISGALAVNGQYYTSQVMSVQIKPNGVDVPNVSVNGKPLALGDINNGVYRFVYTLDKSPQKISITIDEYIRYEDIVQPYPVTVYIQDIAGKRYTWGDKIKVGTEIRYVGTANLLPDLYRTVGGIKFNGNNFNSNFNAIIAKENVFTWTSKPVYIKSNEPTCILAPQTLKIPNASYKILGYIPDLTGKGNHGVFNNLAYTEASGANADGIIQLDGIDDFITIPTLSHGGKQVLMKVNWSKTGIMLYDQRNTDINGDHFAIYNSIASIAYQDRNDGLSYIDGIVNNDILCSELINITHNITITNSNITSTLRPVIGANNSHSGYFAQMSLFAFILFPEISSDEEIKQLNEIVGVEGNTDLFNENN